MLTNVVALEGGSNFRDRGGYRTADGRTVRHGLVFRSAHLGNLTDTDRREIGRLGVRTIVDLRGINEAAETPHRIEGTGATIIGAHIEPGIGERIRGAIADGSASPELMAHFLTEHYRDYPRRCAPGFRTLFATLSDGTNRPLVFHCTAGKDRTGFASALILHALGVADEVIAEDYLLTNQHYKRDATAATDLPDDVRNAIGSVEASYLAAAFEAIAKDYGDLEAYLRDGLKLGATERSALKERYLQA
jgi:protein-tyrosine phosphatase